MKRRYPSLTSLLFEQEEKDKNDDGKSKISKDAVKKVQKEMPKIDDGPTEMLKFLNGPGADPKVRAVLDVGTKDGSEEDEKAQPKLSSPKIGDLIPTQIEIELTKSISFPLAKFKAYKSMMSGGTQKIGPPGNDHIVINGDLIVDGHHRWSSLFSVTGPDGQIAAYDIGLSEKSAPAVLAAVQVGIAASMKDGSKLPAAKAGGKNILGLDKDQLKQLIEGAVGESTEAGEILTDEFVQSCIEDPAVSKHIGIKSGAKVDDARKAIIEKTADNLSKMNQPASGSPPRLDMPQLDKAEGGVAGVIKDLSAGNVNYKPPFIPAKKESISRKDFAILERWNRLAGLIED